MKAIALLICMFTCIECYSQETPPPPPVDKTGNSRVEVMPQFPGGDEALNAYVRKNTKYPAKAREDGIEGKVYISFIIGKDGHAEDVKVLKGIDPACDAEAVRVMQEMPAWTPGMQDGKPVRVKFTMPVVFSIYKPKK